VSELVSSDICIPNIGTNERKRRLRSGIIGLVIAAVIAVVLLAIGADRPWRLILFPLLYGSLAGVFQYREKT
jgi:hypothetical protein